MFEVLYSSVPAENFSGALQQRTKRERFLITIPPGIGDAVSVGLSVVDQIVKNDADAHGKIDVLCNNVQAEIFEYDPRIHTIIRAEKSLFPELEAHTWMRGILLSPKTSALLQFLHDRQYEAVFPSMFAPTFYYKLHTAIMRPGPLELGKFMIALQTGKIRHISVIARQIVNTYFGKTSSGPAIDEAIAIYTPSSYVCQAILAVTRMKAKLAGENGRLIMVAADTTSAVTRPPTSLLAEGIGDALSKDDHLMVCILPSYTDAEASTNLFHALSHRFADCVTILSPEPKPTLLEVAALIDQADIFVTGDTGLMHLAAACKRVADDTSCSPRNVVQMIALFGGTNPRFHGYMTRSTIIGEGRKEQSAFRPGIMKESYNTRGINMFGHISPQQLTDAITEA